MRVSTHYVPTPERIARMAEAIKRRNLRSIRDDSKETSRRRIGEYKHKKTYKVYSIALEEE